MRPLWTTLGLALLATALLAAFCGCAKRSPVVGPTFTAAQLRAELSPSSVTCDDTTYSVLDHGWLVAELEKHVAKTWHDRAYVPEAKDCDDFTDYLISGTLRHDYGEQASPGSGGIPVARYTVAMPVGAHRVALIRTDRGWFVADPQRLLPRPPHTMVLTPLANYPHPGLRAEF